MKLTKEQITEKREELCKVLVAMSPNVHTRSIIVDRGGQS